MAHSRGIRKATGGMGVRRSVATRAARESAPATGGVRKRSVCATNLLIRHYLAMQQWTEEFASNSFQMNDSLEQRLSEFVVHSLVMDTIPPCSLKASQLLQRSDDLMRKMNAIDLCIVAWRKVRSKLDMKSETGYEDFDAEINKSEVFSLFVYTIMHRTQMSIDPCITYEQWNAMLKKAYDKYKPEEIPYWDDYVDDSPYFEDEEESGDACGEGSDESEGSWGDDV